MKKNKKDNLLITNFCKPNFFIVMIAGLCLTLWGCSKVDNMVPNRDVQMLKGKTQTVDLQTIAEGFTSPIGLVEPPDGSNRLFIIDQVGKIWIVNSAGTKLATPFIDVSGMLATLNPNYDERGLLGLAFHPDYKNNRQFYIYYQLPPRAGGPEPGVSWNNLSRISQFMASAANPDVADMGTEKIIMEWDDPQGNHNGGTLAFGPSDGYLYISLGDGGGANDVAPGHVEDWYAFNAGGNAQNIEANLFGSILRIDVNSGAAYNIPASNPFVGKAGKDEIYAYGFRNPYRMSFDMGGTHELYVGDAGQSRYEEIDVVTKGGNYGWNVKEGRECFNAASNLEEVANCPAVDAYGNPLTDPVIQVNNHSNPEGGIATTIIGGNVYRGDAIPAFRGKYIFGTFSQSFTTADGELFIANPVGAAQWPYNEISLKDRPENTGYFLRGFGQDNKGEVYLTVSSNLGPQGTTGKVVKLVPAH